MFTLTDPVTIFTQLNAMVQAAAERTQQPPQAQRQRERRRSYAGSFQFCVMCQKDVHSSKLPCHVRQCHVAQPMFQCPACNFTSTYSKNNVKSHMVSVHRLPGNPISYMDKYAAQVEQLMPLCFPNVRSRCRAIQRRASPRSSTSPQYVARVKSRNSQSTTADRSSMSKEENGIVMAQQQKHASLIAQAGSLNQQAFFANLLSNNNQFGNKSNFSQMSFKTESYSGELVDVGAGESSSASSSNDDNLQQQGNGRSLSMASLRSVSQPVRPGENAQPRYQILPINWSVLNEDQSRSTVFSTLSLDNSIQQKLDSAPFARVRVADAPLLTAEQASKVAEVRAKFTQQGFEILFAIHRMELNIISLDQVESIFSIAPTSVDVQRIKDYQSSNPNTVLSEDEQFIVALSRIERLEEKLAILMHIGKFDVDVCAITQKLENLRRASSILLSSHSFKQMLQLILALENQLVGKGEGHSIKGFIVSRMNEICSFVLPSGHSLLSILASCIRNTVKDVANVFEIIPVLQVAVNISYNDIAKSLTVLEESKARAEQELKEGGANSELATFLETSRTPLNNVYEHALGTKDELYFLMGFMAEPIPHSSESFQPELFFEKILTFLVSLKSLVEQDGD